MGPPPSTAREYRFGPFHLHAIERRLSRDGSPVEIGSRALDILITLVEGAGVTASTCNQWHEHVTVSLLERSLLPLLDGTHSHEALAEHLEAEVRSDRLRFVKDDKPLTEPAAVREFARQQVALALDALRRKALLTA